jgi:hypothetical protein
VAKTRHSRSGTRCYWPFSGIRLLYLEITRKYLGFDILAFLLFALWGPSQDNAELGLEALL